MILNWFQIFQNTVYSVSIQFVFYSYLFLYKFISILQIIFRFIFTIYLYYIFFKILNIFVLFILNCIVYLYVFILYYNYIILYKTYLFIIFLDKSLSQFKLSTLWPISLPVVQIPQTKQVKNESGQLNNSNLSLLMNEDIHSSSARCSFSN